jgi:hypothetical protein
MGGLDPPIHLSSRAALAADPQNKKLYLSAVSQADKIALLPRYARAALDGRVKPGHGEML